MSIDHQREFKKSSPLPVKSLRRTSCLSTNIVHDKIPTMDLSADVPIFTNPPARKSKNRRIE